MAEGFFSGLEQGATTAQNLEMGAVQIEGAKTQVESEKVALQQAKILLEGQKKFAESMGKANQKLDPHETLAAHSERIAQEVEQAAEFQRGMGLIKESTATFEKASNIRRNASLIAERQAAETQKDMTMVSDLMGGVHDQQSFQMAAQQFITARPQSVAMYNGLIEKIADGSVRYDPKTVEALKSAAITNTQRAEMDLRKVQEQNLRNEMHARGVTEKLHKAETAVEEQRLINLKAEGVEKASKVSADDRAAALGALDEAGYDTKENPVQARRAAEPVAERIRDIRREHPEMGLNEAADKAMAEVGHKSTSGMARKAMGPGDKLHPLTAPEPDGSLRPNSWYTTKQGLKKTDATGRFPD